MTPSCDTGARLAAQPIMTNTHPETECPRWAKCSVNNCPLTDRYPDWPTDPTDSEPKCTIAKSIRTRIGSQYPTILRLGGLTPREHASKATYDALSPEAKVAMAKRGATLLALRRQTGQRRGVLVDLGHDCRDDSARAGKGMGQRANRD